jgi:hypothetical protein
MLLTQSSEAEAGVWQLFQEIIEGEVKTKKIYIKDYYENNYITIKFNIKFFKNNMLDNVTKIIPGKF